MSEKIIKGGEIKEKLGLEDQINLEDKRDVSLVRGSEKMVKKDVLSARGEAQKIIEEARSEAKQIKMDAFELMNRVRASMDEIRQKGFDEGREEGLASVTQTLVAAKKEKEDMFADLERQILNLVYDISEKIIGRDLVERESSIVDLIRQALHASSGSQVIVLVNSQDFENIKKHYSSLLAALDASKSLQIRPDDKVAPKGCLIETEIGTIDAQLEIQLQAIKRALGLDQGQEGFLGKDKEHGSDDDEFGDEFMEDQEGEE